mgnify:CR=1 FL=1
MTDRTDGTLTAQVQLPEGGIVFENAYTAEDTEVNTDPADAKSYFNKVLTGRGWLGTDEFTFTAGGGRRGGRRYENSNSNV